MFKAPVFYDSGHDFTSELYRFQVLRQLFK